MNYWKLDECRGLREVFTYSGRATKTCMNCGESKYAPEIEDGRCDFCAGRKPDPEEITRACAKATLKNARAILELKLLINDPEAEIRWWRERIAALELIV